MMFGSSKEMRDLLDDVARTPGFTVTPRRQRALVRNESTGQIGFVKTGASGADFNAVRRILKSLGWPPEPAPEQKITDRPKLPSFAADRLAAPDRPVLKIEMPPVPEWRPPEPVPAPAAAVTQEAPPQVPEQETPMANIVHGRYSKIRRVLYDFLAAHPGQEFTINDLMDKSDVKDTQISMTSVGPAVSSVWLDASKEINPEWLHIHRRREDMKASFEVGTFPILYSWREELRDPSPQALAKQEAKEARAREIEARRKERAEHQARMAALREERRALRQRQREAEQQRRVVPTDFRTVQGGRVIPVERAHANGSDVVVFEPVYTLPDGRLMLKGTDDSVWVASPVAP